MFRTNFDDIFIQINRDMRKEKSFWSVLFSSCVSMCVRNKLGKIIQSVNSFVHLAIYFIATSIDWSVKLNGNYNNNRMITWVCLLFSLFFCWLLCWWCAFKCFILVNQCQSCQFINTTLKPHRYHVVKCSDSTKLKLLNTFAFVCFY